MASVVPAKRKFANKETVDLVVGKNIFHVHKNLLCEVSTIFNEIFAQPSPKQAVILSTELKEETAVVDLFLQWLYTRRLSLSDSSMMQTMQLYVFATDYNATDLMDEILQKLFAYAKEETAQVPSYEEVTFVFDNTHDSEIRQLLVDWYVYLDDWESHDQPKLRKWLEKVPAFAARAALEWSKSKGGKRRDNPLRKDWHFYSRRLL